MRIIKPSAEVCYSSTPYKLIERIGRTCYKSEDKITEDSAEPFIKGLMNRKHFAMIEHSNLVIQCTKDFYRTLKQELNTTYLRMSHDDFSYVVSGSFRAWRDAIIWYNDHSERFFNDLSLSGALLWSFHKSYPLIFQDIVDDVWGEDIPNMSHLADTHFKVISEETVKALFSDPELIMEHINHTIHFVIDRGVSHEFVRHRNCGFAQESTRYCNYAKGKFGEEITVIEPLFFVGEDKIAPYGEWEVSCRNSEKAYFNLINLGGYTPQEARSVLPNSLKTELYITCNEKEWQHIINLRYLGTTGAPHPQMKEVMSLVVEDLALCCEGRVVYE